MSCGRRRAGPMARRHSADEVRVEVLTRMKTTRACTIVRGFFDTDLFGIESFRAQCQYRVGSAVAIAIACNNSSRAIMTTLRYHRGAACFLLTSLISGCAGVPNFYGSTFNKPAKKDTAGHYDSGPKVNDIAKHISCELAASIKASNHAAMRDDNYFIKVFLTLEVDDSLDVTPSLGLIDPFTKAMTNVTTTAAGDLGGARQRIFTATYSLESAKLADPAWCTGVDIVSRKTYRLNGNLGFDEVVDDGLDITKDGYDLTTDPGYAGLHIVTTGNDQSAPSFGSTIKFTITRQLSGLGPLWTLTRFKGPSGMSGLLNGKRPDIDSVILTFSPQLSKAGKAAKNQNDAAQASAASARDARQQKQYALDEAVGARASEQGRLDGLRAKQNQFSGRSFIESRRLSAAIASQAQTVQNRDQDVKTARDALDGAHRTEASTAADADRARRKLDEVAGNSDANASNATSSLLTSMLLQQIGNIQPH